MSLNHSRSQEKKNRVQQNHPPLPSHPEPSVAHSPLSPLSRNHAAGHTILGGRSSPATPVPPHSQVDSPGRSTPYPAPPVARQRTLAASRPALRRVRGSRPRAAPRRSAWNAAVLTSWNVCAVRSGSQAALDRSGSGGQPGWSCSSRCAAAAVSRAGRVTANLASQLVCRDQWVCG